MVSCTKNLKEYNPSNPSVDELWKTPDGFVTGVNGAYSYVPLMFGNDENQIFISEGGTDLWINDGGPVTNYDQDIMQYKSFSAGSGVVKGCWTNLYKAINLCNAGLDHIDGAGFTSETEKNKREGELRFLRAFYYWHIVETWGNVILHTTETSTVDLAPVRSPIDDFYKLITSDLEFAATNLPAIDGSGYEYGRATQASALGMLARSYLSWAYHATGTDATTYFQKAKDAADQVIARKAEFKVDLYTNYADVWNATNRLPGNRHTEALFLASFSTTSSLNVNANADRMHMWFLTSYSGYSGVAIPGLNISVAYGNDQKNRRFMPTLGLLDFYDRQKDARYDGTFQEVWLCNKAFTWSSDNVKTFGKAASLAGKAMAVGDTAMLITNNSIPDAATRPYPVYDRDSTYYASGTKGVNNGVRHVVLKKYLDPLTRTSTTAYPGYLNVVVMRLPEMYFIGAEAAMQLNDKATAASYINVLRTRAAVKTPVDYTAAMQVTASDISIDFILDEKAREMCGEFCRWYDLKRTGKLVSRVPVYNPDASAIQAYHVLRPVPQSQLDATTNAATFGQNPGNW